MGILMLFPSWKLWDTYRVLGSNWMTTYSQYLPSLSGIVTKMRGFLMKMGMRKQIGTWNIVLSWRARMAPMMNRRNVDIEILRKTYHLKHKASMRHLHKQHSCLPMTQP